MANLLNFESKALELTWIDARSYENILASKYITVSATGGRTTLVSWSSLPFPSGSSFFIQKSTSPSSGWHTLAQLTTNDSSYHDTHANNTMNRHDMEYYRLVCVSSKKVVGLARSEGYIDPYGAEIARRHRIQLVNGRVGNKVYVFHRMHNSTRCPECWDDILQKRSRVNCSVCNSTGFIQGYYNPIETYISFGPEQVSISQQIDGPSTAPNQVQCWTSNYPIINVGDVIIEPGSNRIWDVHSVGLTMYKRVITKQDIVLSREDGDDPIYSLINRLPNTSQGGTLNGSSIFQDDAENSAGVRYSGSTTLLR